MTLVGVEVLAWTVTALLAILLAFLSLILYCRGIRANLFIMKFVGFSRIPFIGDAIFLGTAKLEDILYYILEGSTLGKLTKASMMGIPAVVFHHPDHVETLLGNTANITKGFEYFALKPWLREGLVLSDGTKWHQRRKLLTPTFHFNILETNIGQMASHTKIFIEKLLQTDGKPVILEEIVRHFTLDVICETAMGIQLNSQESKSIDYVDAIKWFSPDDSSSLRAVFQCSCSDIASGRLLQVWLYSDWMFKLTKTGKKFYQGIKILHDFTKKVISTRKETRSDEKQDHGAESKRKAFMDLLLDTEEKNPGAITEIGIREEVDTFMFEGHDTTSAAIIHSLYVMSTNPKIQERLFEEQLQIFGSDERDPTKQDLQEMNYLEMFIKEVLRLYPSVPYISRTITQDLKLENGMVVPAGINAVVCPFTLHRHEEFWENPEEFRPERFLPGTSRHPYSYIPFSAGPRNCIGTKFAMLELKYTLSAVARRCRIEPVETRIRFIPNVILRNVEPIQARIYPRV